MKVYAIDTEEYNFLNFGDKQNVKILWLDDERDPMFWIPQCAEKVDIKLVTNSSEFLNAIKNGGYKEYNLICMDHDLGNDSANGSECAYLLKQEIAHEADFGNLEMILIHSSNYSGKKRMYEILHELEIWNKKLKELEK